MNTPRVFCAIDTADLERARFLAETVGPITGALKLGLEFTSRFGPPGIEAVRKACPPAALFLDLKFHDIPNTVAGAVRAVSENFRPAFLNVHASGGAEMMRAARQACHPETGLLAVTVLTSLDEAAIQDIGYRGDVQHNVQRLAKLAQQAGLDGAVCSPHEIELLRKACGPDFILMVPGLRPEGAGSDDQKRVMRPAAALEKGATHLVIGRPITQAPDPAAAAREILESLNA